MQVGGGTETFVSPPGLIITNHHVAFKAVQAASTKEQNHLDNGFTAQRLEDEIRAQGYEALITEKIVDVTFEVKAVLKQFLQPDRLREMCGKRDFGSYRDSALGTLPVDFIETCDITGGNSGSAVLNGKGRDNGACV